MPEIMNFLMWKLKRGGADDIVLSKSSANKIQFKFSNNKISAVQSWDNEALNIFISKNKRLVATSLKDFSKESALKSAKEVLKFADVMKPNEKYMGIAEGPFNYKRNSLYDKKAAAIKEEGADLVEGCINSALAEGAKRTAGVFEVSESKTNLVTSNNVDAETKGTMLYFSMRTLVEKDASGHKIAASRSLKNFEPEKVSIESAQIAKKAINPKSLKAGVYDIVFEPLPYANLLEHVGDSASIFYVEAGLSFLQEKLNKTVGNRIINLRDDATMAGGIGSVEFDDEGVPTMNNGIIENGILKTYLHNTSTAKNYKTKTTANAGLVEPEANNLVLENGNIDKEEMIAGIKKGLLVTNVWYTRFQNSASGDFSTIPRDGAFLIEKGKIVCPVKEIRISDNILDILKNTVALGKKSEQIIGWEIQTPVTTPCALVKYLKVTKSTDLLK